MTKQIQLPDETYLELKELADLDFRSIVGQIQYLLQGSKNIPQKILENSNPYIPPSPMIIKGADFVPKPPDPELGYPCCSGRSPCKHWVFNELESIWTNSLTGKTREA